MRNEYPRLDFVRDKWMTLNGSWEFLDGTSDTPVQIQVPFPPQSKLSGFEKELISDKIVYQRTFRIPADWAGQRIILHFGAVDYKCNVFINNHCIGFHEGGQSSFSFDITDFLSDKDTVLQVAVTDYLHDETIPRGKQFWKSSSEFIWYTQSSGIWQSVWLEPVNDSHLEWIHFTPDIDKGIVEIAYSVSDAASFPCDLEWNITFREHPVSHGCLTVSEKRGKIIVDIFKSKALRGSFHFTGWYWSPEHPNLFTADIFLKSGNTLLDHIVSYFGMRKIQVRNSKVYLNNQPYYQKLLLDQGYWKNGLITAPSQENYIQDIKKAKEMGFNGCRKHEKTEDPVFLYWADKLGFLVWESTASFWSFSTQSAAIFSQEWARTIHRDYNHPCIILWNMLNESWGVPALYSNPQQQHFTRSLYHLAHSLDPTRLVIANDGWEMTENDICAFHSYKHGSSNDSDSQLAFSTGLKSLSGLEKLVEKPLFAEGFVYENQPVMLTEAGGISLGTRCNPDSWGYSDTDSEEDFLTAYRHVIQSIYSSDLLCGFCYTQLADIQQEQNGLLNEDHQFKIDPQKIREINDSRETTTSFSTIEDC